MRTRMALITVAFVVGIGHVPPARAALLTCRESTPCNLADLLSPGNFFEIDHVVDSALGPRTETMTFSNFDALVGDFGGSTISVWGAVAGLEWQLVMEPQPALENPWRIQSDDPDASYLSVLTYELQFDGVRVDFRGNPVRSNLVTGELSATFGDFRNTGGLSITGVARETITDNRIPSSPEFEVELDLTCQELEIDVFRGCQNRSGSEQAQFIPYFPFQEVDRFRVENLISLDYVAFTSGGGELEVDRIVNRYYEPAIVPEPASLGLLALGLAVFGLHARRLTGFGKCSHGNRMASEQ